MRRTRCTALAVAGLLLAGCGGAEPRAAGQAAPDQGLLDFVRCMRRQGIPLADPVVTGEDRVEVRPLEGAPLAGRAEFDAAADACEAEGFHRFGDGGERRPRDGDRDREDAALAFARCVREAGVELPDPRLEDGEITNWDPDRLGIDLTDAQVIEVGRRCADRSGFDPWEDA
jgi:hypothetical protein